MTTLATPQLEQYISQQIVSGQTVVFDEFIFANIPNLTADNLQNHLVIPSASHIVHRQVVSQTGVVNQNAVVYSVTIGSDIGDFDFNFIGLINKSKGLLGIAIYTDTVKKLKNKNGIQGNSLTRSILLEFSNAPQHTNITIPAETWQIDFTLRLKGLDEKIRLTNRDLYGRAVFFDDGFLLKRKSGNNFTITAGAAYVEGVRASINAAEDITLALPCSVYVDVVHHCTVTGAYQTEVKFLKTAKDDYLDVAGNQHYVQILADIDLNGNITDRRLLSPLLGYIPNSKKSNKTDSPSTDNVATSAAVKAVNDNANNKLPLTGGTLSGILGINNKNAIYLGTRDGALKFGVGLRNAESDDVLLIRYTNGKMQEPGNTSLQLLEDKIDSNKKICVNGEPLSRVSIIKGSINNGAILPLPAGFTENECHWIVSMRDDVEMERLNSPNSWYTKSECYVDSSRRVIARVFSREGKHIDPVTKKKYDNSVANYIVIGAK